MAAAAALLLQSAGLAAPPVDLAKAAQWRRTWGIAPDRWLASTTRQPGWTEPDFNTRSWKPATAAEGAPFPAVFVDEGGNRVADNAFQWEWFQLLFPPFRGPINSVNGGTYFRRAFDFTEAFSGCASYLSVSGAYTFTVNGVAVASGAGEDGGDARQFFIGRWLKPGKNVLALAVRGARHAFVETDLHQSWPVRLGQPMRWLCATEAAKNWEQPEFAARGWVPAQPAPFSPQFPVASAPDTLPVRHPAGGKAPGAVYFRLPFRIDGLPSGGVVEIVADGDWELSVNGALAGLEKRHQTPASTRTVDVSARLRPGENLLAVKVGSDHGPAVLACLPKVKVAF